MNATTRISRNLVTVVSAGLAFMTSVSAETIWLRGAIVHTLSQGTLTPGQVVIENGHIREVGDSTIASVDRIIDLVGQHLYPGIIASSTNLGLLEISALRPTRDHREVGEFTPDVFSWVAVNPDSELIPVARANGITHAIPVPQGGILSGQSGMVALNGWTTEEMTIKSPVAMHLFWPPMNLDTRPKESLADPSRWKSPQEQVADRRQRLAEVDDFFHQAQAYASARSSKSADAILIPAWEAMIPVLNRTIPLVIHANEVRQIRSAVEWAAKWKLRSIIAGGRDAWKLTPLLKQHQIGVIYEHVFSLPPTLVDDQDIQFRAPEVLRSAGIPVSLSMGLSGFAASNVRNLPYQAARAVAYGMPAGDALKSMTLIPAQLFGLDHRLGSIEPGKEATFFTTDGDYLDIRSSVTRMWIAGREVDLSNRHTRLFQKYRNRPRPN